VVLGYVVFGDVPDGWTLVGATIVIGSGLYILHRERIGGPAGKRIETGGLKPGSQA
jgi:drug/metabolite transporter (DMT)-like permease